MNKVVTDGVLLIPPKFAAGLGVWSSQDGTPGSDTYANNLNAAFVPAGSDFGGCLELVKTEPVQALRYMSETPPSSRVLPSGSRKSESGQWTLSGCAYCSMGWRDWWGSCDGGFRVWSRYCVEKR